MLPDVVMRWANKEPHRPFTDVREQVFTYGDLAREVSVCDSYLRRLKIGRGTRVALGLPNGFAFVAVYLALLRRGAMILLLPPTLRMFEIQARLRSVPITLAIAEERTLSAWGIQPQRFLGQTGFGFVNPSLRRSGLPGAIVIPTSGSIREPKAVILASRAVLANADAYVDDLVLSEADHLYLTLPLTSAFAHTTGLVAHLLLGTKILFGGEIFRPSASVTAWDNVGAAITGVLPWMLKEIVASLDKPRLIGLRRLVVAGGPSDPAILMRARSLLPCTEIIVGYGLTEAGPRVSHARLSGTIPAGSVGKPLPGTRVAILDSSGQHLGPMQLGEVVVRSASLMCGYEGNPRLTQKVLRGGWLRTGDLGYQDAGGNLYIRGRLAAVINKRGFKISPEEIEEFLNSLPEVAQAVAAGESHPSWGNQIVARVQLAPNAALTADDVIDRARGSLSPIKVPDRVEFVVSITKTNQGKIRRYVSEYENETSN